MLQVLFSKLILRSMAEEARNLTIVKMYDPLGQSLQRSNADSQ